MVSRPRTTPTAGLPAPQRTAPLPQFIAGGVGREQSRSGREISQQVIDQVLRRVAAHANSKLPVDQAIAISPHVLRHTALRKWAEKKGVQFARQISGQVSDRYIWRYVQPSEDATRDAVEALWESP